LNHRRYFLEIFARSRWIAAGVASAIAFAAVVAALAIDGHPSVRAEYAPLGPSLATMAQALNLPVGVVPRVTYGREFASALAPIPGSKTDRLEIEVNRNTGRHGVTSTTLHVGVSRTTGSDYLLAPWSMTKVIPAEDFLVSFDLSRVELKANVCDERTGITKPLFLTWMAEARDHINYGIFAARGGDASASGRFGDTELSATLASAAVQIWGGVDRSTDRTGGSVQVVDGQRVKPVKCPRQ
jgi:hypothetical protein